MESGLGSARRLEGTFHKWTGRHRCLILGECGRVRGRGDERGSAAQIEIDVTTAGAVSGAVAIAVVRSRAVRGRGLKRVCMVIVSGRGCGAVLILASVSGGARDVGRDHCAGQQ